ncbi:hypothetical protein F4778DRAFT_106552 [Xylariomycetidae sp. FL2044]|nr:hypothetical protein F4778DRAFT_106552 [Xylariomycetidae sp. FL2044]
MIPLATQHLSAQKTFETCPDLMPPPEEKICGIREVYRPTDAEAEVDIVAVHGLNGDALRTWTARKSQVCWLHHPDFLPKYVRNARVLVWGYNSSFSTLTGAEPSKNRIHHHAHTLVAQLYADRRVRSTIDKVSGHTTSEHIINSTRQLEGRVDKPIIFLCHSLGGLVVKRALSYSHSRSSDKIAHLQTIFTCTYGIMFFGTPHHGSSKASLLLTMQKLTSLAVPKLVSRQEKGLVTALKEESETLQNITDYFLPLMKNFCIHFFWEQEKTDLKYTKDYIVDKESAAPGFDDTERSGIAADHSGMVKFEHNSGSAFRLVAATLCRFCEDAPAEIKLRWAKSTQSLAATHRDEALESSRRIQSPTSYMTSLQMDLGNIRLGGSELPLDIGAKEEEGKQSYAAKNVQW